jgi:hypothetical protein
MKLKKIFSETRRHNKLLAKRFQIRRFLEINQLETRTRKNCFRYLKHMFPLNVAICTTTYLERQKCYVSGKKILFKIQLFDLEVKGHYGMRHTALWSCTHIPNIIDLSRKKQLFDLEVKGQGPTKVITVCDTPL